MSLVDDNVIDMSDNYSSGKKYILQKNYWICRYDKNYNMLEWW
jgi:hypothetical protein